MRGAPVSDGPGFDEIVVVLAAWRACSRSNLAMLPARVQPLQRVHRDVSLLETLSDDNAVEMTGSRASIAELVAAFDEMMARLCGRRANGTVVRWTGDGAAAGGAEPHDEIWRDLTGLLLEPEEAAIRADDDLADAVVDALGRPRESFLRRIVATWTESIDDLGGRGRERRERVSRPGR